MTRATRWQASPALRMNDRATGKSLDDLGVRLERGSIDIGARIGWDTALPIPENRISLDGSTPLIADYPELFDVYGTTYGGDGITTFGLPTVANTITRTR